jgi:hypothetical protein
MAEEFERRVVFHPAWDKRDPDPKKDCGIHGVEIVFGLIGAKGAITFTLYTNWDLPEVRPMRSPPRSAPMPADLGRHSYIKLYSCDAKRDDCDWLAGGKPCYYEGSTLAAEPVFERLLREGDAGVWAALEETYRRWLEAPHA